MVMGSSFWNKLCEGREVELKNRILNLMFECLIHKSLTSITI